MTSGPRSAICTCAPNVTRSSSIPWPGKRPRAPRWEVSLRCPNCEWAVTDTFDEELIQRFDETLDRGTEALVADLRKLTRANMEDDVERFIAALQRRVRPARRLLARRPRASARLRSATEPPRGVSASR